MQPRDRTARTGPVQHVIVFMVAYDTGGKRWILSHGVRFTAQRSALLKPWCALGPDGGPQHDIARQEIRGSTRRLVAEAECEYSTTDKTEGH